MHWRTNFNDSIRENELKINKAKTEFLELKFKNNVGRNRNDHNIRHGVLSDREFP